MANTENNEVIFYFNSPYYMRDDELESIIKYFEDEEDPSKVLKMKFIFIFKVLNQNSNQFQSPSQNCYVCDIAYDGASKMFFEFMYYLMSERPPVRIESLEFGLPVFGPNLINFLVSENNDHKPSIESVKNKLKIYSVLKYLDYQEIYDKKSFEEMVAYQNEPRDSPRIKQLANNLMRVQQNFLFGQKFFRLMFLSDPGNEYGH